jgi:hypothetical protein
MPINHDRINQNGWRQGSAFTVADSMALLADSTWRPNPPGILLPQETRLIVASHSCDVVSSREHESHIEVCPALPLGPEVKTEQYGHARDPRRLRLPLTISEAQVLHDVHAPLRFSICRDQLEVVLPDATVHIADDDLYDFTVWLSHRFLRRTFPDAFDRRLGGSGHKQIRRVMSGDVAAHLEALLYSISTFEELNQDQPYRIRIVLLAKPRSFQSPVLLSMLRSACDRVEDILSNKEGIVAESVVLEASNRMTLDQYQDFDSWGFEDVSLEADTPLPPS